MLVDNGDKISKLYNRTFRAEQDAREVEKQLSKVEDQQEELGMWLDRYEREVDEMVNRMGGGQGSGELQGVDAERERTYRMAERLGDRLTGLNRDLGEVIGETNGVGGMLGRSGKGDDPVSYSFVISVRFALCKLTFCDSSSKSFGCSTAIYSSCR